MLLKCLARAPLLRVADCTIPSSLNHDRAVKTMNAGCDRPLQRIENIDDGMSAAGRRIYFDQGEEHDNEEHSINRAK